MRWGPVPYPNETETAKGNFTTGSIQVMGSYFSSPSLVNPVKLTCFGCHQEQTVESSPAPICLRCNNVMAYSRSCNRCQRLFWGSSHADRCKECRIYHPCLYCDQEVVGSKCLRCAKNPPVCVCCRAVLESGPKVFCGEIYCKDCAVRTAAIIGNHSIVFGKKLKITYEKEVVSHDGYCSDVDEFQSETEEFERFYPLLEEQPVGFDSYKIPDEGCPVGSNYCGRGGVYYRVVSVEQV